MLVEKPTTNFHLVLTHDRHRQYYHVNREHHHDQQCQEVNHQQHKYSTQQLYLCKSTKNHPFLYDECTHNQLTTHDARYE